MPTVPPPAWSRQAEAIWLKATDALPGSPLASNRATAARTVGKRQPVEDAHRRNEGADRVLKVGTARPGARPVGRDARNRQKLPKPPLAGFEARAKGAQAESSRTGDRHPGPLVACFVAAIGQPRGVADQLEVLDLLAARIREDLQTHALPLDHLALGCGIRRRRQGRPVIAEDLRRPPSAGARG